MLSPGLDAIYCTPEVTFQPAWSRSIIVVNYLMWGLIESSKPLMPTSLALSNVDSERAKQGTWKTHQTSSVRLTSSINKSCDGTICCPTIGRKRKIKIRPNSWHTKISCESNYKNNRT